MGPTSSLKDRLKRKVAAEANKSAKSLKSHEGTSLRLTDDLELARSSYFKHTVETEGAIHISSFATKSEDFEV